MRSQLRPGDRLLLYTDGVTEAFNAADEAYGEARLIAELQAHGDGTAAALVERICHERHALRGTAPPQSDDITLIALTWDTAGHCREGATSRQLERRPRW